MTTLASLTELASYVPMLVLRPLAADPGCTLVPAQARFPAAVLLADLSGFTALTEHLAHQSLAGTEELTRILDLYFGHLVGVVTNHGGDVVKFAGDGLLALWYGDEPLPILTQRAVQCGLAVQMMMAPDAWASHAGAAPPPPLKVRVGVGAGLVTTMRLGGVFGRWELLVTGEAVAQAGQAESEARSGEVLIAAEAWALVSEAGFGQLLPSGAVRLRGLSDYLPMRTLTPPPLVPAMADVMRAFIPKAILARIDAGQNAWLAEQRRVTVLFVQLPDLCAETPLDQAQAMLYQLQQALYCYEGSITRLGTDVRGPNLVAALGLPPLAHEDDPERGVRAALAIRAALGALGYRVVIGVSSGRALCGAVGGQARREYTMMGPMVNRSARLMQAAVDGGSPVDILCDEPTFHAARVRISFSPQATLVLKGFAAPVPVFSPLREVLAAPPPAFNQELIGRARERRLIATQLASLSETSAGGIMIIEGEAGIGKSALISEARARALEANLLVFGGAGSPLDRRPYYAWRMVFTALLLFLAGEEPQLLNAAPSEALAHTDQLMHKRARQVLLVLEELGLAEFAPLLAAVMPLDLPETARTAPLVGQVRADNTRTLLVRLLGHAAARTPLLIILEDAQWLDPSSWALLQSAAAQVPALLGLIATRPMIAPPPVFQQLAYGPASTRLQLRGLAPAELRPLLARYLAVAEVPDALWQLIAARSQGNPFVGEELLHALRERGELVVADGGCHLIASDAQLLTAHGSLPDTVEGLITSRIDRLSASQQLTLKVASVIGPLFTLNALAAIHPVERDRERLVAELFALQQAGLIVIDAFEPDMSYVFKRAISCEVAYNLMSFGQRRRLHQLLAERYEAAPDEPTVDAIQIAHHWRQARQPLRALPYLAHAGAAALHSGAYREAASLLDEALAIAAQAPASLPTEKLTRARWERQLGAAYHGMGRLVASREQLERAVVRLDYPFARSDRHLLSGLLGELTRQIVALLLQSAGVRSQSAVVPTCANDPAHAPYVIDGAPLGEAARAYAQLAQLAYYNNQLVSALYATLRGLNLAEREGRTPTLAAAYASAALAAGALPFLASHYQRRALTTIAGNSPLPTWGWIAEAQALAAIGRADWRRAAAAARLGIAVATQLGDQRRRAECVALLGLIDLRQGRWRAALSGCEDLRQLGLRAGDGQVRAWGLLAAAEALQGLAKDAGAEALLGEAEALLAENVGGARAEEVWAYALLGRAALRRQAYALAATLAGTAAGLLDHTPPATLYTMGGYVAIAEIYLGLWAAHPPEDATSRAACAMLARRASRRLNHFALIFPVARPAALICSGLAAWQAGRRNTARRLWHRARRVAARLDLPYEAAQAAAWLRRYAR